MKKSSSDPQTSPAKKRSRTSSATSCKSPRADVVLSNAEKKRRQLFDAAKKHHRPSEIEILYGEGRLPVWAPGWLLIQGARQNNLKSIDVPIPLSAFTAVTGVSGSGKSSLVDEILSKELARVLNRSQARPGAFDRILGIEHLNKVIEVDQQPLGMTPTSNPATYTGLFEQIRNLYAQLPESRLRGWSARRFSFNVPGGRCEKCEGAGQIKIEMHFLADVWITCEACGGKRYDAQTLEVTYRGKSIADVLEMSCGEALEFFSEVPPIRRILKILCDVGLDYIALGQSATMLSGGEAQRVKLAAELARPDTGRTLYILDEPTTGLHFEDLKKLLAVLQRLVDMGNTVVVIEHNLDVIKSVDWIVDLGPEAGLNGGQLVFAGTPEELAEYGRARNAASPRKRASMLRSWTAEALIPVLESDPYQERSLYDPASEISPAPPAASDSDEETPVCDVPMPWETDGRNWHTKSRRSRNGSPCRWDGQVLAEVADRIEDSGLFADIDWNNRAVVEVRAAKKSLGWFFHAITGEEWLLKLKFRVPRGAFDETSLMRDLWLKPVNEIGEIPLYGTQPRVRVQTVGPWYEVEMRVFSYDEFNRPEVWAFLDKAIEEFCRYTETIPDAGTTANKTPWKTEKEEWHFTPSHFCGSSDKPVWDMEILSEAVELIRKTAPGAREVWTNRVTVPFYLPQKPSVLFAQLYTKNSDCLILQINLPKKMFGTDLYRQAEVDDSNPDFDAVYLRFVGEDDFDSERIRHLLELALEG